MSRIDLVLMLTGAFLAAALIGLTLCAGAEKEETNTPKVTLAADGYPTGQDTPEGVACDMTRAFINADGKLFRSVVVPPFGGDEEKKALKKFVDSTVEEMEKQKTLPEEKRTGPKSIGICFAARHLTKEGPASAAYALYDIHEVMFVDVGSHLREGGKFLCRTLVVMDKRGKWYAHPCPSITPIITGNLNEESDSKETVQEKYKLTEKK